MILILIDYKDNNDIQSSRVIGAHSHFLLICLSQHCNVFLQIGGSVQKSDRFAYSIINPNSEFSLMIKLMWSFKRHWRFGYNTLRSHMTNNSVSSKPSYIRTKSISGRIFVMSKECCEVKAISSNHILLKIIQVCENEFL
jgi:hypothetical protein